MNRSLLIAPCALTASLIVSACVASLTQQGARVQPVTDAQKERACEFLTMVTASESYALSSGGDAKSAMNKIRNAVAKAGGNAMRIVSTTQNGRATTVTAEALECDLAKLRS